MLIKLNKNSVYKKLIITFFCYLFLQLSSMSLLINIFLTKVTNVQIEHNCCCPKDCPCRKASGGICQCHKTNYNGLGFSTKCACSGSANYHAIPIIIDPYFNNKLKSIDRHYFTSNFEYFFKQLVLPEEPIFEIYHPRNFA